MEQEIWVSSSHYEWAVRTDYFEDLSPFFEDRCSMFVLLAREANVGVILRRGPAQWWRLTLWDTQQDRFEGGQWFRGTDLPGKVRRLSRRKAVHLFRGQISPSRRRQDVDRCQSSSLSDRFSIVADWRYLGRTWCLRRQSHRADGDIFTELWRQAPS